MKILIDFDDTIFDTARFKFERIYTAFLAYQIPKEKVADYYEQYRNATQIFSFRKFIYFVAQQYNIDVDENEVGQAMFSGLHNFTFPFVSKLAGWYGEENMTLLTYGDKEFQEKKVEASGIISLFDNVVYTEEDKEDYIRKYCILNGHTKVSFIDDTFRHFILHNPPKNLIQICINATGKLTETQLETLKSAGVTIETNRDRIAGHLRKCEGK